MGARPLFDGVVLLRPIVREWDVETAAHTDTMHSIVDMFAARHALLRKEQ